MSLFRWTRWKLQKASKTKTMGKRMIRSLTLPWHHSMVKKHSSNLFPTPTFLLFSTPKQSPKEGWSTQWSTSTRAASRLVQGITSRMLRSMEGVLRLASAWGARTGRDRGGAQGHLGNGVERVREEGSWKKMNRKGGRQGKWWQHTSAETLLCTFTRLWPIKWLK